MKPHVIRPEAEAEIVDAFEWYAARSPELGSRFIDALTATLARVCETPLGFPRADHDTRSARVFGFPYSLFFADEADLIIVYAVFHERRHPRARAGRTPSGS